MAEEDPKDEGKAGKKIEKMRKGLEVNEKEEVANWKREI